MKKDKNKQKNNYVRYLSLIAAPLLLAVAPVCGYFIGYWLDNYFHTGPYLAYLFLFLGMAAGFREFYKLIKELMKNDKPDH